MVSKKARKEKELIIDLSLDHEKTKMEMDVDIPGPTYADTKCYMEIGIVFKWGDLY
jgi:hypothetical protein